MKSCSLSVRIAAPVHFLVPCCMLSLEWAGGCTWGKSCFPSPPDEMLMAESDGPPAGVPQLHPPIAAPQFKLLFFPPPMRSGELTAVSWNSQGRGEASSKLAWLQKPLALAFLSTLHVF